MCVRLDELPTGKWKTRPIITDYFFFLKQFIFQPVSMDKYEECFWAESWSLPAHILCDALALLASTDHLSRWVKELDWLLDHSIGHWLKRNRRFHHVDFGRPCIDYVCMLTSTLIARPDAASWPATSNLVVLETGNHVTWWSWPVASKSQLGSANENSRLYRVGPARLWRH